MFWLGLFVGAFVGAIVGVVTMSLIIVGMCDDNDKKGK